MNEQTVSVTLLGKTYPIKCAASAASELQAAADYLNNQFNKLAGNARSAKANDTLLLITALNLAHELIQMKAKLDQQVNQYTPQLQRLIDKLDVFLSQDNEILV